MTGAERGFLLLTSSLGDPARKVLTKAQFRTLARRAATMEKPADARALTQEDLLQLGYDRANALHILQLLQEEERLDWYLQKGKQKNCIPITRISAAYPARVRLGLGLDSPGVLWAKGDTELLNTPAVALVGSRDLAEPNRRFAEALGREAARQGITLISGNARGADQAAQNACLAFGGKVISVVADALEKHAACENVLYLSEDCFDGEFSAQRALSRNRVIHSLGEKTFVAQCNLGVGGTWDGTAKNLQNGWSPVFCFADGSKATEELLLMGAAPVKPDQLSDLRALQDGVQSFL